MTTEAAPTTLGEIAGLLEGELRGPAETPIHGIQSLDAAGPEHVSFAVGPRFAEAAQGTRAGALILPKDWPFPVERPAVFVDDPYLAYALVAAAYSRQTFRPTGIGPHARIGADCEIHPDVSIHDGVHIGDRVVVASGVTLHPGVCVGDDAQIAEDATLHPNVVIYPGCRIGRRVSIHAGTVIGSDGFGYTQYKGRHVKIPQTGIVVIEDDVEIGANVTIDRAALGETRIGRGTKIDNLVQVGHNVQVGPNSILIALVGIAGSTRLGAGVVLGGQVGVAGHLEIGDGVMAAAQSGIAKSLEPGETVSGSPAMPHRAWLRISGALKKLPKLLQDMRELEDRVKKLESEP